MGPDEAGLSCPGSGVVADGEITSNDRGDLHLDTAWNGKLFLTTEGGIQ